ncbi:hypothetical protein OWP19_23590 [Bacillus cereus]|uniref:DNA ligase LigA-related protein n=1 Tax=Bacillus cereus TaxID=1396 RepID=UPI002550B475|nr:hypothetical protein [Bacillus cereus]MDK7480953.1 hypothetical protein [Bacillus cereus]
MVDEKIVELITRRRRQLLVHSFIYYQMNQSIIADYTFDLWSKELVELQQRHPEEANQAVYAKEFVEFDGASGFDLPYHYPEVQNAALHLLKYVERMNKK